jgi:squalene-hopene/tetraprenyl-beta-curcumene cyclase
MFWRSDPAKGTRLYQEGLSYFCMMHNSKEDECLIETGPVLDRLSDAIANGVDWLLDRQDVDGFWVGMLESNSCMEAQWILAMHFLGIEDKRKLAGMVASILNEQRADGSWEIYHNAPAGDINTTVECYAALRAAGCKADDEALIIRIRC